MRVMLQQETKGLPELTDGLTALTAWVMWQTEGDGELRRQCLTKETWRGIYSAIKSEYTEALVASG